jgi:hypothetical protein
MRPAGEIDSNMTLRIVCRAERFTCQRVWDQVNEAEVAEQMREKRLAIKCC